jgi:hypothetical protein
MTTWGDPVIGFDVMTEIDLIFGLIKWQKK